MLTVYKKGIPMSCFNIVTQKSMQDIDMLNKIQRRLN